MIHSMMLADVPPGPGYTRKFQYCLKITNLKQYPNYLLFIKVGSGNPSLSNQSYKLIKANQCTPIIGYRPIVSIAAIEQAKVKTADLAQGQVLKNSQLETAMIKATETITPPRDLPIVYQGKQVEDSYQIQAINATGLQLVFSQRSPQMLNTMLFPLLGMAILGVVIWKQKAFIGNR